MKKIAVLTLVCLLGMTLAGCSGEKKDAGKYPFEVMTQKEKVLATIEMEKGGIIELELYPDIAPISVSNFKYLAETGFYDGLTFHRIVEGFVIQGGCPQGNGTGGPGYQIKGEFSSNGVENPLTHERGVISMARSQMLDSAGSQFFIIHGNADFLDGDYAAFGRVTSGMEVVDEIVKTPASGESPLKPVVIKTITIK